MPMLFFDAVPVTDAACEWTFTISPGVRRRSALGTHHGDGVGRHDLYGRQDSEVGDVGHDVDEGHGRHGDPDGARQVPARTRLLVSQR